MGVKSPGRDSVAEAGLRRRGQTRFFRALDLSHPAIVHDQLDDAEAEVFEWSLAGALRPKTEDWFTMLVRYTRQVAQRPIGSTPTGLSFEEQRDALSIEL